jgi:hypothetical protein
MLAPQANVWEERQLAIQGLAARTRITVASALLALKAVLGLWVAFALITASASNYRSFLGESITSRQTGLGLLVLALAVITLVVVAYLIRFRNWARWAAISLEAIGIVLALSRVGAATGPALIAIALSLAVITLLLSAGGLPDRD